jgi:hypothetical protein
MLGLWRQSDSLSSPFMHTLNSLVAGCEGVGMRVSIPRESYHNDNDLALSAV